MFFYIIYWCFTLSFCSDKRLLLAQPAGCATSIWTLQILLINPQKNLSIDKTFFDIVPKGGRQKPVFRTVIVFSL